MSRELGQASLKFVSLAKHSDNWKVGFLVLNVLVRIILV